MTAETAAFRHTGYSGDSGPESFASDDALQNYLLRGVSRTFALTIPQLPSGLVEAVSNGYLLCRIVDTIEDDPALDAGQKKDYVNRFVQVVAGEAEVVPFAASLALLLSDAILPAEHELIQWMPEVIRITHSFDARQREALRICVRDMAEGMIHYQQLDTRQGLESLADMERYCYYVAGVVGEMLCRLFCAYSPRIDHHHEELLRLSVAFGQGLQMTNILKDIWDDQQRGACWLPRDLFRRHGFDLADLGPGQNDRRFEQGLEELIGIAFACLQQALEYTLLIPRKEAGIRNFCFWSIGMAELTLARIHARKDFRHGDEVKISRRNVRTIMRAGKLAGHADLLLRGLFAYAGRGLPRNDRYQVVKRTLETNSADDSRG